MIFIYILITLNININGFLFNYLNHAEKILNRKKIKFFGNFSK